MSHACTVQYTCLSDYTICRESSNFLHMVSHQIKRIGNHDDGCIWCVAFDSSTYLLNNFSILTYQVFTSHSGFSRESTGNYNDVTASNICIVCCTCYCTIIVQNIAVLAHVKSLAFRKTLKDVQKYNVGNFHLR